MRKLKPSRRYVRLARAELCSINVPFSACVPPCHDSRQSETALFVARGTRRLLRRLNFSTVTELPLLSGRRADIVALAMDATILIVEIKSSIADFRADTKWRDYRANCDKLFFAIPENRQRECPCPE